MMNTFVKFSAFLLALFLISHHGGVEARVETEAFEACKTNEDCVGKCTACAGTASPNCKCIWGYCLCSQAESLVDKLLS
ncbi:hypothetical protein LINGRAHAP2_LOCUS12645 [Linum grandiflorum]